jgi:hypothetical protein
MLTIFEIRLTPKQLRGFACSYSDIYVLTCALLLAHLCSCSLLLRNAAHFLSLNNSHQSKILSH